MAELNLRGFKDLGGFLFLLRGGQEVAPGIAHSPCKQPAKKLRIPEYGLPSIYSCMAY
jgi:hypothetical protein